MKTLIFCLALSAAFAVSGCKEIRDDPEPKTVNYTPEATINTKPYQADAWIAEAQAQERENDKKRIADLEQKLSVQSSPASKVFVVSDISAQMSKIDDIGLLFVRHDDGSIVLAQSASWKYGVAGSAKVSLNQYLKSGTNLLVFAVYNDKSISLPFGKSVLNKWRYELSIVGDRTTLYSLTNEGTSSKNGVASFAVFSIDDNGNGQFNVGHASKYYFSKIESAVARINNNFENNPVANNVADVAAVISAGITESITSRY